MLQQWRTRAIRRFAISASHAMVHDGIGDGVCACALIASGRTTRFVASPTAASPARALGGVHLYLNAHAYPWAGADDMGSCSLARATSWLLSLASFGASCPRLCSLAAWLCVAVLVLTLSSRPTFRLPLHGGLVLARFGVLLAFPA